MSTDNLDAAQQTIAGYARRPDALGPDVDTALQIAQIRALVDIARSLRGIETALSITPARITRC